MFPCWQNVVKIWFRDIWVAKAGSGANNPSCLNDNVYRVRRADESFGTPCEGIMARSGMKRDRNMRNTTMPKRAISVVLAAVLACTLMPSASLAYAAEGSDASSAAEETQTQTTDAETAAPAKDAEAASASDADPAAADSATSDAAAQPEQPTHPPVVSESRELAVDEPAADAAANADAAPAVIERVAASVALGQQAGALFTYNGLTYEVISADNAEAALVGLSNTALEGSIEVPAQVSDGTAAYTVSAVKNCGGGVRFPRLPQPTVK